MEIDESIRRLVLQISGRFYEIKEEVFQEYVNQIDSVFNKISNSIDEISIKNRNLLIQNLKEISNTIIDELISILLKESIKIIGRSIEQLILVKDNDINVLNHKIEEMDKEKKDIINNRDLLIRKIFMKEPQFKILDFLEKMSNSSLKNLMHAIKMSETTLRKYIKQLDRQGYVSLIKSKNGLFIKFKSAPWAISNLKIDSLEKLDIFLK